MVHLKSEAPRDFIFSKFSPWHSRLTYARFAQYTAWYDSTTVPVQSWFCVKHGRQRHVQGDGWYIRSVQQNQTAWNCPSPEPETT